MMQTPSLPRIKPIVPKAYAKRSLIHIDTDEWLFELQYDGIRGMLYKSGHGAYFQSIQKKPLHNFYALAAGVAPLLPVDRAIFDGEIVAFDTLGRPAFNDLLQHRHMPVYRVFDLLWLHGEDLRGLPLAERRARLEAIVPDDPLVRVSFGAPGMGAVLFAIISAFDLEGIIAKRLADTYAPATTWYRIKNTNYSQRGGRHGRPELIQALQ